MGATEMTLDQAFPYKEGAGTAATASGDADQLRTWDYENQKFNYYFMYYKSTKGTVDSKSYHWVENNPGASYPLAKETIKTGDSVFFYSQKDQMLTVPGQVPAEASGTLNPGYNMISIGFPSQWNPNDAGKEFWQKEGFTSATASGDADQIRYWDQENQKYRFFFLYYKSTKGAVDAKSYQWVENLPAESYPVLDEPLKTGDGFFYILKGDKSVEFKPGLKLQ